MSKSRYHDEEPDSKSTRRHSSRQSNRKRAERGVVGPSSTKRRRKMTMRGERTLNHSKLAYRQKRVYDLKSAKRRARIETTSVDRDFFSSSICGNFGQATADRERYDHRQARPNRLSTPRRRHSKIRIPACHRFTAAAAVSTAIHVHRFCLPCQSLRTPSRYYVRELRRGV